MMVQEDKNQRQSKKLKEKKTPQRGLGVAQLERIRLEEQCKKIKLPASVCSHPFIPISSVLIPANDKVHKFWNSEFNSLPEEKNPNLKLVHSVASDCPSPLHPSMEMSTFSPSPPLIPFPTEPPSNQSDCDSSILPKEHKIVVSMKRAYPFALENQAGPSCEANRFPFDPSKNRGSDESRSAGDNGGALLREAPVSSTFVAETTDDHKKGLFDTNFLTLAPPINSDNCDDLAFIESLQTECQRIRNDSNERCLKRSTPFYNFIQPAVKLDMGYAVAAGRNICGYEQDEDVDLSLKL